MQPDRRRIVVADIAAGVLLVGAGASCLAVSFVSEWPDEVDLRWLLSLGAMALVAVALAWRAPRARLMGLVGLVALGVSGGFVVHSILNPIPYAHADDSDLPAEFRKLVPLHRPLPKPRRGEWLDRNPEFGQSYGEYVAGSPVRPDEVRRVIYVQPLGEFGAQQRKIVELTAEFLGLYYHLPVRMSESLPLSVVPDEARRLNPRSGEPQLRTDAILLDVLKPRAPPDAVVVLGLTTSDLYGDEDRNYVFGRGSLTDRVGVWSLARLGDPATGERAFIDVLRRTLHIAAHETGHMFSLQHCIYYRCCLNGANHRDELDRQPLWLCPRCQAKLAHATGAAPAERFADLAAFADKHGLTAEARFWRSSLAALRD